jgi:hypothetical protein
MRNASRSCRKTFSSLDDFEEHYDCTQEVLGVVSIAAITGEGCVVIQRRLLFRLVLAMVLLDIGLLSMRPKSDNDLPNAYLDGTLPHELRWLERQNSPRLS